MQEQTNIPQIQIESIKSENIVDTLNKLRRGELSLPNSERQIQETANALSNAIVEKASRFVKTHEQSKKLNQERKEAQDDPLFSRMLGKGESRLAKRDRIQDKINDLNDWRWEQKEELDKANKAFSNFLILTNATMTTAMIQGLKEASKRQLKVLNDRLGNLQEYSNEQFEILDNRVGNLQEYSREQFEILNNRARNSANAIYSLSNEVKDTQDAVLEISSEFQHICESLVKSYKVTLRLHHKVINFFRKLFKKEQVAQ